MSWTGIHENDYGWIGKLTLEQDGTVVDISGYTTRKFLLRAPGGTVKEKTAVFDTNGTDGVLKYTFVTGDIDEAGDWHVAARVERTGVKLTSNFVVFKVDASID